MSMAFTYATQAAIDRITITKWITTHGLRRQRSRGCKINTAYALRGGHVQIQTATHVRIY